MCAIHGEQATSRFTTASDVYAFGVLAYELFTHADIPFRNCSNTSVMAIVLSIVDGSEETRNWLVRTDWMPEWLYRDVMSCCWARQVPERPSFFALLARVSERFDGHRGPLSLAEHGQQAGNGAYLNKSALAPFETEAVATSSQTQLETPRQSHVQQQRAYKPDLAQQVAYRASGVDALRNQLRSSLQAAGSSNSPTLRPTSRARLWPGHGTDATTPARQSNSLMMPGLPSSDTHGSTSEPTGSGNSTLEGTVDTSDEAAHAAGAHRRQPDQTQDRAAHPCGELDDIPVSAQGRNTSTRRLKNALMQHSQPAPSSSSSSDNAGFDPRKAFQRASRAGGASRRKPNRDLQL